MFGPAKRAVHGAKLDDRRRRSGADVRQAFKLDGRRGVYIYGVRRRRPAVRRRLVNTARAAPNGEYKQEGEDPNSHTDIVQTTSMLI